MRGVQLARQWKIIRLLELRRRGLTASDIATHIQAPVRTVYRDLESILEAGFPLYTEKIDKNSLWKMVDSSKNELPLPLTTTELMALLMSRDILKVFEGTIFQESIESLFTKVKTALSPQSINYIDNLSASFRAGLAQTKNFKIFKEVISQLSEATAEKRQVEIRYRAISTGEESIRKIDPYQVWAMNGCLYIIGYCHMRKAVRTFAMDRVRALNTLNDTFLIPADFSLESYMQCAFRVMPGQPEKNRGQVHAFSC